MALLRTLSLLVSWALATVPLNAQVDFSVDDFEVIQVIQDGTIQLIAERPTVIKTLITVSGPNDPPADIDGIMRVYVDGIEAPDSPLFSTNGPITTDGKTLNFLYIPPDSDDVVFEAELNPPGPNHVPETDTGNNVGATASLDFRAQQRLDLVYSPIDYRPNNGPEPNLPNAGLIKPGVGDNFVQGIFASADIRYRRTDAPSKLWTSSVASSGSGLNNSLATDLFLMSPQPDYIYGWINGGLSYNGQAFINGVAAMGNTQSSRHQRTYAHELGHNVGRLHNSLTQNMSGQDVEQHLWLTQFLKKKKDPGLFDIMVAGQLTPSAWVAKTTYNAFLNHPNMVGSESPAAPEGEGLLVSGSWHRETGEIVLDPVLTLPSTRLRAPAGPGETDLVIRGLVDGQVVRSHAVSARTSLDTCPGCQPAEADPSAEDAAEGRLATSDETPGDEGHSHEARVIRASGGAGDRSGAALPDPMVHFATVLPARGPDGRALQGLELTGSGTWPARPVRVQASAHAPQVVVTSPRGVVPTGRFVTVSWEASDEDGDPLAATLRYVPDGDEHIVPLVKHTEDSEVTVDLLGLPHFRQGTGHFEVLVTDGFHTARAVSEPLVGAGAYAAAGGNAPFVEIYHPDDGFNFNNGAPVILHAASWDLEDLGLEGADLSWSSDVDGALGTGLRLVVTDLSVGEHQITVTATDSGGAFSTATNGITVLARDLPSTEEFLCATDLGFAGPGSAAVTLCGGDLTQGGVAELSLTGAPGNALAFFVLGLSNNPTPLKGGTLVPFPWAALIGLQTDAEGNILIPGISGTGPLTLYLQFIIADGTQTQGYAFSNALQADF